MGPRTGRMQINRWKEWLPGKVSNLESPDSESGVLPVTPPGNGLQIILWAPRGCQRARDEAPKRRSSNVSPHAGPARPRTALDDDPCRVRRSTAPHHRTGAQGG